MSSAQAPQFDRPRVALTSNMWMKKSGFDSVNADLSVANVIVELLRNKNVHEASVLRFGSGGALGAAHSRV